jgi:hypothetical protein
LDQATYNDLTDLTKDTKYPNLRSIKQITALTEAAVDTGDKTW